MNLIIGFLILVCLAGSEFVNPRPVENVWPILFAVLVTVAIVPGLAFFQTVVLLKKLRHQPVSFENRQSLCRRMTLSHSLVWLSASLAIIWSIRWQDVVRGTWALDRWPLLDECLILLPMVVALVASWLVFYELQSALSDDEVPPSPSPSPSAWGPTWSRLTAGWVARREFVSVRFRLYFLLVLIPVGVFVLLKDLTNLLSGLPEPLAILIAVISLAGLIAIFPLLILMIWKNGAVEDLEFEQRLLDICRQNRLSIASIRVWQTGNQIVNAVVIGVLPRFRMILLSDGLLNQFAPAEIEAVIRHEAGHIRLWHLPTRMLFMLIPLLVLAIGDPEFLRWSDDPSAIYSIGLSYLLVLLTYGIYLQIVMRWLSHQMEFEADMHAIQRGPAGAQCDPAICDHQAQDMIDALLRLAAISPTDWERNSLFHPSIRRRVGFLQQVQRDPNVGNRFRTSFARRRRVLAGLVLAVSIVMVLLV